MKQTKTIKRAAALLACLLLCFAVSFSGAEYDAGSLNYELVWADEFDTDGLPDPALWGFNVGGGGWGNGELQYYMPKGNAAIENGVWTAKALPNANTIITAWMDANFAAYCVRNGVATLPAEGVSF